MQESSRPDNTSSLSTNKPDVKSLKSVESSRSAYGLEGQHQRPQTTLETLSVNEKRSSGATMPQAAILPPGLVARDSHQFSVSTDVADWS